MEAVLIFFYMAVIILMAVSMWIIFAKAGKPGWAILIPFYNIIIFLEIIKKPWWWLFLWLIPVVNCVFIIWSWNLMVKKFGKSEGFTVGVILLGIVFVPILAFDESTYEGMENPPASSLTKGQITDSIDKILLIIVCFMLLNAVFTTLMQRLIHEWYLSPVRYINFFFNVIAAFIPVFLGVIIKDRTLKILGIIFGSILALLSLYQSISWIARVI